MNYDRTPDMGSPIYLSGCSCEDLWDNMENTERSQREDKAEAMQKREECQPKRDFEAWPVGVAYVPMQPWEEPFDLAKGLRAGTIFPSLRMPFRGGGC